MITNARSVMDGVSFLRGSCLITLQGKPGRKLSRRWVKKQGILIVKFIRNISKKYVLE